MTFKNTELFAETIQKQDEKVLSSGKTHSFLHVYSATVLYVVHKCPIMHPETKEAVGIMGYVEKFMSPNMLDIIFKINNIKVESVDYGVKPGAKLTYKLTEKQHMVLFLVVHKYSFTEISNLMTKLGYKMSSSRVNGHIENLKYIFNVQSKEALTEKAIALKYHLFLPRKFVKIGTYDLDSSIMVSAE